jgi:ankyrin repeat protein
MKALAPYIGMPAPTMGPPTAEATRAWLHRIEGKMAIAQLLIEAGADVRATSPDGATPLHFAALAAGPEGLLLPVVRVLIRRGVVVDARTSAGRTPLQFAVWAQRHRIAKVLVAAGANLDARDVDGKTAADELVSQGNQRALDELRALATKRP